MKDAQAATGAKVADIAEHAGLCMLVEFATTDAAVCQLDGIPDV